MNKEQKQRYLGAMTAYLKKQRSGYRTTPLLLISHACRKEAENIGERDRMNLIHNIFRYAEKEGLLLDPDFCNGETVGLPGTVPFRMYRKKPGARCPFCGSRDTAGIMYGYPCDYETVAKEMSEHRISIGGCCPMEEEHHCFHCERDFGRQTDHENVVSVTFVLRQDGQPSSEVMLGRDKEHGCIATVNGIRVALRLQKWKKVIRTLFSDMSIPDWEPDCSCGCASGMTKWKLTVVFQDGSLLEREGDLTFLCRTEELERLFGPFMRRASRINIE